MKGLKELLSRNSRLESLNVSGCANIEDEAIQALSIHKPPIHSLWLTGEYFVYNSAVPTWNKFWIYLFWVIWVNSSRSNSDELTGCVKLTDKTLIALSHIHSLKLLDIESCSNFTDDGLLILASRVRGMRVISLALCSNVTGSNLFLEYSLKTRRQVCQSVD
jgi:hypothetical protein